MTNRPLPDATDLQRVQERILVVERQTADNRLLISTHEEKCAGRYRIMILLLAASLLIALAKDFPVVMPFISMLRIP